MPTPPRSITPSSIDANSEGTTHHRSNMKVLILGSGGREHALAWKLAQEAEVFVTPGNPGMAEVATLCSVPANDQSGVAALCHDLRPDLVVVGPEDPLIAGIADHLRNEGFAVYGPQQNAATLEGSKAWSKKLMAEAGVPTAAFASFEDPDAARAFAHERFAAGRQVAVKASGNALGKGVVVALTLEEAEEAIQSMMVDREFGEAGSTVVIEDRLVGHEFSLLSVVSDGRFVSLPVAQDYKRALDGDRGPNTGGMGTYSPVPHLSDDLIREAEELLVAPMVRLLEEKGIPYRGTLFTGVMVVEGKPWCLEYNVRFGDPETQSVVRRLGRGFADLLMAAATGQSFPEFEVKQNAVVTVVVASGGYPGPYAKGVPITLGEMPESVVVFHAGTGQREGQWVTTGGRVLAVSAEATTLEEARRLAYQGVDQIQFEGKMVRTDIASIRT